VISLAGADLRTYDPGNLDRADYYGSALVVGPHSRYFVIDTEEQMDTLGVNFKPGGGYPFFGMPAHELHERHVSLESLWGRDAARMVERVALAATPEEKFALIVRELTARLAQSPPRHRVVPYALGQFSRLAGAARIGEVAEQAGLSQRRFIELFRRQVGLTPKTYSRLQRFQQVIRSSHPVEEIDWLDVALGCGYYDQAHFIRDFRDFSGLTPSAYLRRRGEQLYHIPGEN
jgi:AraC-like DNA-binding protein